jgi:flagellar M-ring protein FliF
MTTIAPRPVEEIAALQTLVQSAIGFTADRGDSVTIESMAFDESVMTDLAQPGLADRVNLDLGRLLQTIVLAVVAVLIVFGLLRPMLRRDPNSLADDGPAFASLPNTFGEPGSSEMAPMAHGGFAGGADPPPPMMANALPAIADPANFDFATNTDFDLPALGHTHAGPLDPVERLRRLIEEREDETMEILRNWMEQDEEIRS